MQRCFLFLMHRLIAREVSNMAEGPSEPSVSSMSIEDDVDPRVIRERQVVSILDKLKAPNSSDFSRKRKLASNTARGN